MTGEEQSPEEIRLRQIREQLEELIDELEPMDDGLRFAMLSALKAVTAALSMIDERFS